MLLKDFFERIYPYTRAEMYYPSRKNTGILVLRCFSAAGSSNFRFKKEKKYTAQDVPLERKLFDGSRPLTPEQKKSFSTFDVNSLAECLKTLLDDSRTREVMLEFGIPPGIDENCELLCLALAIQVKAFIDSADENADDIVMLEYQRLISEPSVDKTSIASSSPEMLYRNDPIYFRSPHRPTYEVDIYETFQHTWMFDNVGKQTWRGRKLFFANHAEVRPSADQIYIDVPDTPPNKSVTLTVTMNSSGFEGTYECKWIMIDSKGNDCYRNSSQFDFVVHTRFVIE